jgi:cytochrome P450
MTMAIETPAPRAVPGSYSPWGLGTLVHTVDFRCVSGWLEFFRKHQRRHGSVFKANILFHPAIVATDHRAIAPLFDSEDFVQDYGFAWAKPPLSLVGYVTPSIFENGPAHDRPKALYMRMLRQRASTLSATFDQVAAGFIDRWAGLGKFSFCDELEDLAASFLFQWFLGQRPDPCDVRTVYQKIFNHIPIVTRITQHFPWSSYSRSLVIYHQLLAFVKATPRFPEILAMAREEGLRDEDFVAKQITFLIGMNSFLGTQNLMKSIIGELSLRPELCEKLRLEIGTALGAQAGPIDLRKLDAATMPLLDKTLREILRLHPPVTLIYGRATRDCVIESSSGVFRIPKGELLMGVIPFAHLDPAVFPDPERFDPDRFDRPASSAHLIWPRGLHDGPSTPGNRTCPGKDVAILIAKLFAATLLMRTHWRLREPPQWEKRKFPLNVAAPKGALEVESFTRP